LVEGTTCVSVVLVDVNVGVDDSVVATDVVDADVVVVGLLFF